jgi:hypothetical protein
MRAGSACYGARVITRRRAASRTRRPSRPSVIFGRCSGRVACARTGTSIAASMAPTEWYRTRESDIASRSSGDQDRHFDRARPGARRAFADAQLGHRVLLVRERQDRHILGRRGPPGAANHFWVLSDGSGGYFAGYEWATALSSPAISGGRWQASGCRDAGVAVSWATVTGLAAIAVDDGTRSPVDSRQASPPPASSPALPCFQLRRGADPRSS